MYHKKHKVPIYFGELHVFIFDDFIKINDKFKFGIKSSLLTNEYEALTGQKSNKHGLAMWYVLLKPDCTLKIVAHETAHLVNFIFVSRDITLDAINDEPQAYLTGFIFEKIEKSIEQYKILNKKM